MTGPGRRSLGLSGAALLLLAAAAGAQPIPGGVSSMAVMWAQGEYRSPMICEIDGQPARALRRVVVRPGPRRGARLSGRLTFFDLEAPSNTVCYGETGGDQPNLIGALYFVLEGRANSDTARHDFDETLRRKGGFAFDVTGGSLRGGPPGAATGGLPAFELAEAELRVDTVARGSDAFRRLADFGARDKRVLTLQLADGRSWSFDLVRWDPPDRRRPR